MLYKIPIWLFECIISLLNFNFFFFLTSSLPNPDSQLFWEVAFPCIILSYFLFPAPGFLTV